MRRPRLRRDCAQIVLMTGGSLRTYICAECAFVFLYAVFLCSVLLYLCSSLITFVNLILQDCAHDGREPSYLDLCKLYFHIFCTLFVKSVLSCLCSPLVIFVYLILQDWAGAFALTFV